MYRSSLKWYKLAVLCLAVLLLPLNVYAESLSTNFNIQGILNQFAGGGVSSTNYKLKASLSQPIIGVSKSNNYSNSGGVWATIILSGNLSITSTPSGAKIYLDDTDTTKTTPATLTNIPIGTHTLRLTKSGYKDWYGTVIVLEGQTIQMIANLFATNLQNVIVYPNPCRVYHGQQIHFKRLTAECTIKVFNIVGELVKEIEHTNGTDEEVWANPGSIASGIYIYLITNRQGHKAIGKIGIIK